MSFPLFRLFGRKIIGTCSGSKGYLCTPVELAHPYGPGEHFKAFPGNYCALWDTGARNSMISQLLANKHKLLRTGVEVSVTGVNGTHLATEYLVAVSFSNGYHLREIPVLALPPNFKKNFQLLLGLDIILKGYLYLKGGKSEARFSFKFV